LALSCHGADHVRIKLDDRAFLVQHVAQWAKGSPAIARITRDLHLARRKREARRAEGGNMSTLRKRLSLCFASLGAPALAAVSAMARDQKKPNVSFIMADDWS
jgi:hypothetical protein